MDAELSRAYASLSLAMSPEDVFGSLAHADGHLADGSSVGAGADTEPAEKRLKVSFHALARACHPDRFHDDPEAQELAIVAFKRLAMFYDQALDRLARGVYGTRTADAPRDGEAEIRTAAHVYRVSTSPFVEGDLALFYRGVCAGAEGADARVVAKVARDPADNDLVRNEVRVLRRLWLTPSTRTRHLPMLLDVFKSDERQGLVLRDLDALDGPTLREKLPAGVPVEHTCWILQRLLSALSFAHGKGVVHGNIEPSHVLVRPRDHNVFLIDWSYGVVDPVRTGERFRTLNEVYSAPEVETRGAPTPAADLFSTGKTMIYLLGGDPETGTLPPAVPPRLARLLTFLTLRSARGRAQDAWEMHREVTMVREELFGAHRFVDFVV